MMNEFLYLFDTNASREEYEGGTQYAEPYVSVVEEDKSVHYNQDTKVILTLTNNEKVTIYGKGILDDNDNLTQYEDEENDIYIQEVEVYNGCTEIGNNAFENLTHLITVKVGKNVNLISEWAFIGNDDLSTLIVDSENKVYDSRDNCNAIIETSTNKLVKGSFNTVVPQGITTIGEAAFANLKIEGLALPSSVKDIEASAFEGCLNLTSVTDQSEADVYLGNIGDYAFSNCEKLSNDIFIYGNIGEFAFDGCQLVSLIFIHSQEEITVGENAFRNSFLSRIVFDSCNHITLGKNIFSGCTNFQSINFANCGNNLVIDQDTFAGISRNGTVTIEGTTDYTYYNNTLSPYLSSYGWTIQQDN